MLEARKLKFFLQQMYGNDRNAKTIATQCILYFVTLMVRIELTTTAGSHKVAVAFIHKHGHYIYSILRLMCPKTKNGLKWKCVSCHFPVCLENHCTLAKKLFKDGLVKLGFGNISFYNCSLNTGCIFPIQNSNVQWKNHMLLVHVD